MPGTLFPVIAHLLEVARLLEKQVDIFPMCPPRQTLEQRERCLTCIEVGSPYHPEKEKPPTNTIQNQEKQKVQRAS
eukprot:47692-Amphidinium_carterae.1